MPKREPRPKAEKPIGRLRGDRIRELREARGWTQMELAHRTESFPPVISTVEAGKREIRAALLVRVCLALDCSADYLLNLSDDPKRR